jgi:heavy metal sensor kinase
VIILGAILTSFSLYLYLSLRVTLYEELDSELFSNAQSYEKALDLIYGKNESMSKQDFISKAEAMLLTGDSTGPGKRENLRRQRSQKDDKPIFGENYVDFLNEKGESLLAPAYLKTPLFTLTDEKIEHLKTGAPLYGSTEIDNVKVRAVSYPYFLQKTDFYIIQAAASLKPVTHILRNRVLHILASASVILFVSGLISKNFANKILRPVFEISKTAGDISEENLSARVEGIHNDKEMKILVDTFNSMIARLENSFKVISDFSSQVAHELKTPLTIIRGESDIALRRERHPDEYRKTIMTIVEESNRMLKIIDDILLLTKLNFPNKALNFERLNLVELLKDMHEQLVILASRKETNVTLITIDDSIYINGNKNHLRRMFLNLIDNAIKYSGTNGKIDVVVSLSDNSAAVSISDTGSGIPAEDLPHIFDRFYRVTKGAGGDEEGTGLGLSIVKSIIDIHGGSVGVKSEVGTGTTFTLMLPAV